MIIIILNLNTHLLEYRQIIMTMPIITDKNNIIAKTAPTAI